LVFRRELCVFVAMITIYDLCSASVVNVWKPFETV